MGQFNNIWRLNAEIKLFLFRLRLNAPCTTMSEKLCLKWNDYHDYQDNVNSAFASLREENDFADVTLACEDGQQIEAHKVILASSSPFFQNLLKKNKHPHPLIVYSIFALYQDTENIRSV